MGGVVYIRSARPNPASLLRQRERCEALARQHGHEVVNCYADIGRAQPNLRTLIEEAKAQKFGAVFVFGLSGISRNVSDFTRTVGALTRPVARFTTLPPAPHTNRTTPAPASH